MADDDVDGARRPGLPWRWIAGAVLVIASVVAVIVATRPPEPDPEEFCDRLAAVADLDDQLATAPDQLAESLDGLDAAAEVAPAEVAADVTTLQAAVERLATAAEARPDDPTGAVQDELAAMQDQVGQLEASSARLAAWSAEQCGLSLTGPDDTAVAPQPGGTASTTATTAG